MLQQPQAHATKSVSGDYRGEWNDLVAEQQRSKKDKAEIVLLIIALIILFARRAYLDGMKQNGVDDPESHLSTADNILITSWASSQSAFADGMAQAIIDSRTPDVPEGETVTQAKDEARQRLLDRGALWAASLGVVQLQGMVRADEVKRETAPSLGGGGTETMATWRYGDTQHCHIQGNTMGCYELNGLRRPLSYFIQHGYIPQQPGSQTLTCGGWYCQCGLYDDSGKRLL
jgi:hypothetical protein